MLSLSALILGGLVLQSHPAAASARQPATDHSRADVRAYAIAARALADTLDAIALASGRQVKYDAALVRDIRSAAVEGTLTVRAAVEQALSGTGLVLREDADGTLEVGATTVQVTAKRDEAETSFKADRSNTATRSGGYLRDIPASVTLITAKVLETQQITTLQDALRNVSGVVVRQSPQAASQYTIRGFVASSTSNGVSDANAAMTNVFGVERLEVLKGPQAILSGGDSLGGGVNVVTKKPQAAPVRDLTLQYGTHADKTVALDLSDALTQDRQWSYRLIGAVAQASSAQGGYDGRENRSFMPAVRWKSRSTDVVVGASYTKQHAPTPFYTFAGRDGSILPAPSLPLANGSDGFDTTGKRFHYQFEQQISPKLVFVSRFQRSIENLRLHIPSPAGLQYSDPDTPFIPDRNMAFFASRMANDERTSSGDHYVRGAFSTADIQHKLSLGYNHSDTANRQEEWFGPTTQAQLYPAVPTEFAPIAERTPLPAGVSSSRQQQKAVYLQDMASYGDWTVLLNARRTRYHTPQSAQIIDVEQGIGFTEPAETTFHNSPGAGVVYQLAPQVSLYASYAQGFAAQSGLGCDLTKLPPSVTTNKEVGTKLDLFDSKLSLTASLFSLRMSNYSRFDLLSNCFNPQPGQRTQGVEIDAQGQPTAGLDLIFNYSYKQVKDQRDPAAVFAGEQKHKMSFWSNYSFQAASLKGYGFGVGFSANSSSLGTFDTTAPFRVPGQAQIDASLFYSTAKLNLILGVKNLADRTLYQTATSTSFVPLSPGREFMLTVKRSFN